MLNGLSQSPDRMIGGENSLCSSTSLERRLSVGRSVALVTFMRRPI
jgi:hypothetical protein